MEDDDLSVIVRQLDELRAEQKATERSFALPGLDVPWWNEQAPIRVWSHNGIVCAIAAAGYVPSLAGYVRLPDGHPWREFDLGGDNYAVADVHGGITFGPHLTGWIGFDTAHSSDNWTDDELARVTVDVWTLERWAVFRSVLRELSPPLFPRRIDWTIERLVGEVESLADQVSAGWGRLRPQPDA